MAAGSRRYFGSSASVTNISPSELGKHSFKKTWLSDPSTYPIFFVLGFAVSLASCFIFYKVRYCNDVRVTSSAKGHVVRTWA
jgi:NADH-ubiquinone reductase complex 1 MLRQ subunit